LSYRNETPRNSITALLGAAGMGWFGILIVLDVVRGARVRVAIRRPLS
jgi:hypothetical protein